MFKAVRALLAKPQNYQLSLSYCEKATGLFKDGLNLGPHCNTSTLDKVCTCVCEITDCQWTVCVCALDRAVVHCSCIACA